MVQDPMAADNLQWVVRCLDPTVLAPARVPNPPAPACRALPTAARNLLDPVCKDLPEVALSHLDLGCRVHLVAGLRAPVA